MSKKVTPCHEGNKSVLFNLSKLTVTLSKLVEGGIQDSQVFTIIALFLKLVYLRKFPFQVIF